jgi:ABC-type bacteriocin/lantibiotic exporter with double-glycine peptidase domain
VHDWPGGPMSPSLYGYVLKVSGKQQVRLGLLTLAVSPLASVPLELQRQIVNHAVVGSAVELLLAYGGLYLAVLLLQGGLKFVRDIYMYRIAEGVTRLLRRKFIHREPPDAGIDEGTTQAIISSESEKVGGFVAESISLPLLQAGTVLSIAAYMLVVEPLIAVVAIAFLVPSIVIVGFAQPILNRLSRSKITVVRALGESVLRDGRDDAGQGEAPGDLVERIYGLRLRFANIKNATKSLNQLITGLGLLSILLVGGWLAIEGRTEIGIIVAFMSGYERMTNPTRDLLNFYRRLSMMRVQYRLVAEASP